MIPQENRLYSFTAHRTSVTEKESKKQWPCNAVPPSPGPSWNPFLKHLPPGAGVGKDQGKAAAASSLIPNPGWALLLPCPGLCSR